MFFKVKEKIISTVICKKCAECCKNHPFVDVSRNEILALEKLTGLSADVFTNSKGKLVEEYFLQFQSNGYCFFLREKNGTFSCDAYEARPEICRKYPASPIQKSTCDSHKHKIISTVLIKS